MMARTATLASVIEDLSINGFASGDILFREKKIGRYVTHGSTNPITGKPGKMVFASRIYGAFTIQVKSTTSSGMVRLVGKELVKLAKDKKIDLDKIGTSSDN